MSFCSLLSLKISLTVTSSISCSLWGSTNTTAALDGASSWVNEMTTGLRKHWSRISCWGMARFPLDMESVAGAWLRGWYMERTSGWYVILQSPYFVYFTPTAFSLTTLQPIARPSQWDQRPYCGWGYLTSSPLRWLYQLFECNQIRIFSKILAVTDEGFECNRAFRKEIRIRAQLW